MNITGAVTFHTFSGVLLRPYGDKADDTMPAEDLWTFQKIGDKGKEITGYPAASVFHEFRYHPKEVIGGVFDDWVYEHLGAYAWTVELWAPQRQAGVAEYKYIDWFRDHPHEEDVKMLEWSDKSLNGKGYADWRPFQHPQLGAVEIGGWDREYAFRNPPPQYLEKEVEPLADWVIWQAALAPRLRIDQVAIEGGRVRVSIQNVGWLSTHVTKQALKMKMCRGVVAEVSRINGSSEAWLISGKLREEGPQLEGGNSLGAAASMSWGSLGNEDRTVFEWVLASGEYEMTFRHDRAGTIRQRVTI